MKKIISLFTIITIILFAVYKNVAFAQFSESKILYINNKSLEVEIAKSEAIDASKKYADEVISNIKMTSLLGANEINYNSDKTLKEKIEELEVIIQQVLGTIVQ